MNLFPDGRESIQLFVIKQGHLDLTGLRTTKTINRPQMESPTETANCQKFKLPLHIDQLFLGS